MQFIQHDISQKCSLSFYSSHLIKKYQTFYCYCPLQSFSHANSGTDCLVYLLFFLFCLLLDPCCTDSKVFLFTSSNIKCLRLLQNYSEAFDSLNINRLFTIYNIKLLFGLKTRFNTGNQEKSIDIVLKLSRVVFQKANISIFKLRFQVCYFPHRLRSNRNL